MLRWPGQLGALADRRDRLLIDRRARAAFRLVARAVESLDLDASLMGFLVDSVDLSVAYRGDLDALAWIREFERRSRSEGRESPERIEALRALRLQVLFRCEQGTSRVDALWREMRWELLRDRAWAMNLRLFLRLQRAPLREVLRQDRPCREVYRNPFDRARRLTVLATRFSESGDTTRFARVYRAALKLFRLGDDLRSRVFEALLVARHGRTSFVDGDWSESLETYRYLRARYVEPLGISGLGFQTAESAAIENELGRTDAARLELDRLEKLPRPRLAAEKRWKLACQQSECEVECQSGNTRAARRTLRDARRLAASFSEPRTRELFGHYLDCSEARIESREGESAAALERLTGAEAYFRALGEAGHHGIARSMTLRSEVLLRAGDKRSCLETCQHALDLARSHRFVPIWIRALLLKSYLLIDGDLPTAESVYEEVLRDLGVLKHPILLFRVVANLYLYTWSLEDESGLELTDLHLGQLEKLKNEIDAVTYRELYETYVTPHVWSAYAKRIGRRRGDI